MEISDVSTGGGDDEIYVILWSGGTISDFSSSEPKYSGSTNVFQKVSKSMSVDDFSTLIHEVFGLNPSRRLKIYSKVFLSSTGAFCFVDISNSQNVGELVRPELHKLTATFSFFVDEVTVEGETVDLSHCSFKGSNANIPTFPGDISRPSGAGGSSWGGQGRNIASAPVVVSREVARSRKPYGTVVGNLSKSHGDVPQQKLYTPMPPLETNDVLPLQRTYPNQHNEETESDAASPVLTGFVRKKRRSSYVHNCYCPQVYNPRR